MTAAELAGLTAVVTGAARGQGRSHALHLARAGAVVVAIDVCETLPTVSYAGADPEDLEETARLVRAAGGEVRTAVADVRNLGALTDAVRSAERVDIVVANAGIAGGAPLQAMSETMWREMIDVDLTGAWNTVKATVPKMIDAGQGGSVVLISSANGGLKAPPHLAHYAAAKHGLVGLMRSLANELAPHGIRVNSVHPTAVDTDMIHNDDTYRVFRPDLETPTRDDVAETFQQFHSLPVPWIEPEDVSKAVLFLASPRTRYVTGICLPVDAGLSAR